jgi:hypothetical protein
LHFDSEENMTPLQWFAVGALASASFAALAAPAPAHPLDGTATVPAPTYQSAFDTYRAASGEAQPSADKVWRSANDELAKSGAHDSHPVPEAVTPAPAPKAPPADHSKHH